MLMLRSIVVASLLAYLAAALDAAQVERSKERPCPERPLDEIRAQVKPAPVAPGDLLIDRAIFWERMEKIARVGEVFTFESKKKDKATGVVSSEVKKVVLYKSILDDEHRAVVEAIFRRWEATGGGHPKHLALILGTAYRETCGKLASTVGEACGCAKTCSKDEYKVKSYGQKDSCGRAYFGRGFVQLTHASNYEAVEEHLHIPLRDYPALAYEEPFAIRMLVDGVKGGWYAGEPLNTYLNDRTSNWVRARESVNPNSPNKAATGYLACRFYDAIQPAYKKPAPAQDPGLCMKLENL